MKIKNIHLGTLTLFGVLCLGSAVRSEEPSDSPRPIPLTRPELKQLIENVKVRTPRIPLPQLTDKDRQELGDRADSYESRLRYHYLAGGDQSNRFRGTGGAGSANGNANGSGRIGSRDGRPTDPKNTLDNAFKVELFWIVSRANNCQYCLGHQESKLLNAGLSEDRIASLDGDWKDFTPAERVAYAFARKYTYQPHLLTDEDLASLKKHFTEDQILEMMLSMAGNNSINRWKEGVGVPQNATEGGYSRRERGGEAKTVANDNLPRGSYLTPTSDAYLTKVTSVAPFEVDPVTGKPSSKAVSNRPALESRTEVEQQLARCRERISRLPLVDEPTTRQLMSSQADMPVANWLRLLAQFPGEGVRRAQSILEAHNNADLNPKLKAQLSWIVARNDRAWYATAEAKSRLNALGCSDDDVFSLDGDWSQFSPTERSLFVVAKNLGASPVVLTDREVAEAVELAGPAAVVQAVNYVTHCAAFNRITEAAGLPIE